MAPPRARRFRVVDLGAFDAEALEVFLQGGPGGIDPVVLGVAARAARAELAARLRAALPASARARFAAAHGRSAPLAAVERAERQVVDRLFWPLLYWHEPEAYEELVDGERLHPAALDVLELEGRAVCDVGSGAGRFTEYAATRADRVVAVDAVPPLLDRLAQRLRGRGVTNVELRRGSFTALPLADASVDVAVACSSVTSRAPFGGEAALEEMERVVRPGGQVAVVWPDRPAWFCERGFTYVTAVGNETRHFADAAAAERLCADYYSATAARWVARHGAAEVPYEVLGVPPPNDICVRQVAAG